MAEQKSAMQRGLAAVFEGTASSAGAAGGTEMPAKSKSKETKPAGAKTAAKPPFRPGREGARKVVAQTSAGSSSKKKRPGAAPAGKVKATYYIDETIVVTMKHLAVDLRKRESALVEEGLREIIKKYEKKRLTPPKPDE